MAEWLWRVTQAIKSLLGISNQEYSHGLSPRGFESPSVQHYFLFLFFCFFFGEAYEVLREREGKGEVKMLDGGFDLYIGIAVVLVVFESFVIEK